jgi:hypothetical protein
MTWWGLPASLNGAGSWIPVGNVPLLLDLFALGKHWPRQQRRMMDGASFP